MESIWNTVATILATGIVIYGGYFLRDFLHARRETEKQKLEREREIREARRKYRDSIVAPIRDALVELGTNLEGRRFMDTVRKAKEEDSSIDTEKMEELEKFIKAESTVETLTKTIPLIATITSEDAREFLRRIFLKSVLISTIPSEEFKNKLHITDENMKELLNSAYQKLEDYVALAD